ncbi:MAG: protein rep [Hyphomicrobium zavarzinii]|jgi:hypothetical protein|uniref:hypothetical protein n=1 Tax=Hyphomicrobium zavarzinii TaxID=48292 RepID=UPI001A4D2073|nr:hypothetical protein [Hyphomicrobium zavarzinii]MBL8845192.1 protein rep [Hyphomicrobium zavarzinii]
MRLKNELFGHDPVQIDRAIITAHRASAPAKLAAERMEACIQNWQQRTQATAGTGNKHALAHRRCRSLLCPRCQDERMHKNMKKISNAFFDTVIDDIETSYECTLTAHYMIFLGHKYPLSSADQCLDDTFNQWNSFSRRKVFQRTVAGFVRGIELDVFHDDDSVSSSVTVLALVRPLGHADRRGGWKRLWQLSDHKERVHLTKVESWNPLERGPNDFLIERILATAMVGARPTNLSQSGPLGIHCSPEKLAIIQTALKGRRLLAFGGGMRRR